MTKSPFSDEDRQRFAQVAGLIIPASDALGLPGADDPAILDDILASAAPQAQAVTQALTAFACLPDEAAGETFRARHPEAAECLQSLVVQCYYRDARVLRSLGMEPRAPFPKGHEITQGDWSLLDPVRAMPPLYRKVD